jgi:hypothetical protein
MKTEIPLKEIAFWESSVEEIAKNFTLPLVRGMDYSSETRKMRRKF